MSFVCYSSLLRLEPPEMNKMALECFASIMRYMGDLGLLKNQHEVDCVNTILMYCHKFEALRDEVYCQIMRQTTNNKSGAPVRISVTDWYLNKYTLTFSPPYFRILAKRVGGYSQSLQLISRVPKSSNLTCSSISKPQLMIKDEPTMVRHWFAFTI